MSPAPVLHIEEDGFLVTLHMDIEPVNHTG